MFVEFDVHIVREVGTYDCSKVVTLFDEGDGVQIKDRGSVLPFPHDARIYLEGSVDR